MVGFQIEQDSTKKKTNPKTRTSLGYQYNIPRRIMLKREIGKGR